VPTNSAGFRFVEIGSSDIDRSLDFYRSMLDFTPVDHVPWPPPRLGLRGVGIGAADPDAAVRRLVGCGAQQVTDAESPVSGPLLTDPDGIPLQAVTAR
jgi:catechol 2,3-dioxygenase-like lactoylglutathione lyase family enzyme